MNRTITLTLDDVETSNVHAYALWFSAHPELTPTKLLFDRTHLAELAVQFGIGGPTSPVAFEKLDPPPTSGSPALKNGAAAGVVYWWVAPMDGRASFTAPVATCYIAKGTMPVDPVEAQAGQIEVRDVKSGDVISMKFTGSASQDLRYNILP